MYLPWKSGTPMRHSVRPRPGLSPLFVAALTTFGLLLVGGGIVFGLVATGTIDLPVAWMRKKDAPPSPDMLLVPVSSGVIPPYTRISRDHIWDAKIGQFTTAPVHKNFVTPEMFTGFDQFKGRVLRRQKPKGYAFTESDFLPKGSREGISGGIPPGKRAVVLDASKLAGVHGLREGDHVDILASQPLDFQKGMAGRNSAMRGPQAALLTAQKQASTRVIVQNGVLVQGVTSRAKPITSSSLTQGTQARTVPVLEVILAVDPEEVAPLHSAVAVDSQLNCVARSGQAGPGTLAEPVSQELPSQVTPVQPKDKESPELRRQRSASFTTPGDNPLDRMTMMEGLIGNKRAGASRQLLVFPAEGRGPVDLNKPPTPSDPGGPTTEAPTNPKVTMSDAARSEEGRTP
ncbi:MAG: exported protein of unknown function [Schlesneria sp.]|nr:exported protein of unknown function [Schlesneria sp.]